MTARRRAKKPRTAKKKASHKKTARKPSARRGARGLARLEKELPRTLRDARQRMRSNLDRLEGEVQRTRALYRGRATRLLREASHRLGRLEAHGERGWSELNTRTRSELVSLLRRLERAVAPAAARKSPRRKA